MTSNIKELLNNTKLFAIGSISSKLIVFLMIPLYARIFSKSEFGIIDILQTSLNLFIPLITIEIIQAVFRFTLENDPLGENNRIKEILSISIFFSLLSISFFSIILYFTPIFEDYKEYKLYFILILYSQILLEIIKSFFQGSNQIKKFIILDLIQVMFFVSLNILFLIVLKLGIFGFFIALFISQIISILYALIINKIYSYISIKNIDINLFVELAKYSIPLISNTMLAWIIIASDRYILAYYDTLASVGIYAMSIKIPLVVLLIFGIFMQAWQIGLSKHFKKDDLNEFVTSIFSVISVLLILLVSILILINQHLLNIVLTSEFSTSWIYVPGLLLAVLFQSYSSFLGVGYIASKQTKGAMYTTIFAATLNIILNFILIPIYSISGAVFATFISYFLLFIIRVQTTKQFFILKYNIESMSLSVLILMIQTYINIKNVNHVIIYNFVFLLLLILINKKVLNMNNIYNIIKLKRNQK